jgi:hypothetical protein
LGSNVVQSHQDYLSAGQAEAFSLQATASGFAGAIHLYIDSRNRAGTVVVGLYSNAGNRPGSLLSAGSGAASTAGTWTTVSIAPSQLTSGTTYWLAILGEGGTLRYRDRSRGPCPSQTSAQTSLGGLPASWSTGRAYADCPASAYVTPAATVEPPPVESPPPPVESPPPPVESPPPPPPPVEEPSPPPPPPTASFSYSPTSPVAGQPVTLDGTSSTCPDGPCTYAWSDDGSTTRPISPLWPLGSGQTLQFTFSIAGTKYVRLVVTDAIGRTATIEHNVVVVEAPPPPPPVPPVNAVLPAISGVATEGQALQAASGTWTGSPTSFAYQWQDCDSSGAGCVNVNGATASSYTLASSDVGHTLRVVVSASNTGGSVSASSAATAVVSASGGGESATCTTTVSNLASVVSLSGEEPDGSTICIADGSYGTLTLTAARAGYVTIAAANGPGHVTLSGLTFSSAASHLKLDGLDCTCNTQLGLPVNGGTGPNNIQITRTDSQGFQVEAGSHDLLFDHDYSHAGPYGFLLNGSRYPVAGGCCRTANYPLIENVTISNSKVGPLAASGADAFQVKGFNNLKISNNDINDIYQNGNHNDGVQTVHGGSNLTITHNYFHDGNVELFMIKDGDITGTNFITDNLVVRENSSLNPACGGCSTAVFGQYYSPQNATIANNTIVEPGLFLRSQLGLVGNGNPDYLVPSNINVSHNVINEFRAQDDDQGGALGSFAGAMTTSYNMFGPYTKNYLTAGTGDTFVKTINNTSSIFVNPSSNDFRLASNPNNIGVDWKPSEYHYGP